MTNSPINRFAEDIQQNYGLVVSAIYPAPRGFAAETYYVDIKEGHSVFLKIMNNPRRQSSFMHGLEVVNALVEQGIDFIPPVIKTSSNQLCVRKEDAVFALFTRIEATQSYDYNRQDVFQKLAHIYQTSVDLPHRERFKKEEFNDWFIDYYSTELHNFISANIDGDVENREAQIVKNMLLPYADFLKNCPEIARSIVSTCKDQQAAFFLTHSDYTGNVMISASGKHYLIDFDEALYAPIERDSFMSIAADNEESRLWISIIQEVLPDYQVNQDFVRYYLYERFMIDMATFLQELLHHPEEEHKRKIVKSTKEYLLGWLYPLIQKNS